MTLQYRIRSKYQDERWRRRVYLCERLVSDAVDRWCSSDAEFPTQTVVAGVLHLFSPRCEPFELSPYRLCERLVGVTGPPADEYRATWPRRPDAQGQALVAALTAGIEAAVLSWNGGRDEPSVVAVAEGLAEAVVAQQYVVFHHRETTRRDANRWGI